MNVGFSNYSPLLAAGTSNAALVTFLVYTLAVFGFQGFETEPLHNAAARRPHRTRIVNQ